MTEKYTVKKGALKKLKEIGDYQEMRIQELYDMNSLIEDEIDKKIAVLTDVKIKSFQNGDEELLMKIKFSIQVLRELKEVIQQDEINHLSNFGLHAILNKKNKKIKELEQRIKELEIENEAQSDAIDGLQEFMAHYNLEESDVE